MEPSSIVRKLRLDKATSILVVNAPIDYQPVLDLITYDGDARQTNYEFVQIFAKSQIELEILCNKHAYTGKYDCLFWACYPKSTGSIKSDIKRETVWKAFDLIGLEAVTQVAIDNTWSALRGRPKEMVGK